MVQVDQNITNKEIVIVSQFTVSSLLWIIHSCPIKRGVERRLEAWCNAELNLAVPKRNRVNQ